MKRLSTNDFIGFLMASRVPNLIIIGSAQYLTVLFLIQPNGPFRFPEFSFFLLVVSTVMIAAGGYIINDYYDQKIDMVNRPDKVVVGTIFRRRLAILAHFLLTFGGISLGFYLNVEIGVIHLFSSFFLWYYSNHLRRITLIGNLIISFLTGLTLLLVMVYKEQNEPLVYIYALFAMAIILIREVIKDIEDVKGDAAHGCQSIPVIFGIRGAKLFLYLVIFGSAALLISYLFLIENWLVRTYFLCLFPIFVWFIYRLKIADTAKEYAQLIKYTNLIVFSGLVSILLVKSWF